MTLFSEKPVRRKLVQGYMKGEIVLYISLVSYIVDSMHLASILKKKDYLFIYIRRLLWDLIWKNGE